MDLASVVAALASVGVRVSGSTPNSSVQVDSSRACPTGLAGPEPSGTINDPGQHFHWSANAPHYIPQSPSLPDVPPPSIPELRGLARAARKTSPGPDGVPPYLIAILPDAQFQVVHRCLELCYESGHIPHPWLISETFCIFK